MSSIIMLMAGVTGAVLSCACDTATKATHNFEIGTKDVLKMVGIPEEEGDALVMDLLDEKLVKLEAGKLICLDLAELEKRVAYYKKKTMMDRKREKSRAM